MSGPPQVPPWSESLVGHAAIWERFRRATERGRLGGSYLFVGPPGIGKRTFALHLARALFCERRAPRELSACGECQSCRQVARGAHPDLEMVGVREDKNAIAVEDLIGKREHRMREGLCHNISLSPMQADRRIAIIDDADTLQAAGANCLLKTLEEPPPRAMLILISANLQRQLPTIRSRCKLIRFFELEREENLRLQLTTGRAASREEAEQNLAAGGFSGAGDFASPEAWNEFRREFPHLLLRIGETAPQATAVLQRFVDKGGKDGPPKRARMRRAADLATELFRQLLHGAAGGPAGWEFPELPQAWASWAGDADLAAASAQACIEAAVQIDANVNAATWTHAWLDALGRLSRSQSNPATA